MVLENRQEQRLSAGGIIVQENKVLLVHHCMEDGTDFWVMPGGGLKGSEGIFRAVEREIWEETGLSVRARHIAYIEELIDDDCYVCKFWLYCSFEHGKLSLDHREAAEGFLKEVSFFSKAQLQGMNVFPPILKGDFWQDYKVGFPTVKYLGYQLDSV